MDEFLILESPALRDSYKEEKKFHAMALAFPYSSLTNTNVQSFPPSHAFATDSN